MSDLSPDLFANVLKGPDGYMENTTYFQKLSEEQLTGYINYCVDKITLLQQDVQQIDSNLEDSAKIDLLYPKHSDIWNIYPIVCRYLVCIGQFSVAAFDSYIRTRKQTLYLIDNDRDDWLCRRRADYVVSLCAAENTALDKKELWDLNYETLTKEMKCLNEFRAKAQADLESNQLKMERVTELLNAVKLNDEPNDLVESFVEKLKKKVVQTKEHQE